MMTRFILIAALGLAGAAPPESSNDATAAFDVVRALETALAETIARAEPSVVAIARFKSESGATTAVRGRTEGPIGDPIGGELLTFDFGSGVVVGPRGEILTTYSVIRGAARLHVRAMGRQRFDAEVIAADPRSDLAVIVPRVPTGAAPPNLVPIKLGDASALRKGHFLVALGNPFNAAGGSPHEGQSDAGTSLGQDGRPSASWGILANVSRRIEGTSDEPPHIALKNYPTLLQLDSKLNLGMSGGAVVNLKGELVGITTTSANVSALDSQAGYAIPLDRIGRRAVETLIQGKEVEYGLLGIILDTKHGTSRVENTKPGTPADGEVQTGDLIVAVGDVPVHSADSLALAINAIPAGERVVLKVLRQDKVLERPIELAKYRVDGEVIATNRPPTWRGLRVDYKSVLPDRMMDIDLLAAVSGACVAVAEVQEGSPADQAGLKGAKLIKSVGGRGIRSPADFAKAVAGIEGPVMLGTDLGMISVK